MERINKRKTLITLIVGLISTVALLGLSPNAQGQRSRTVVTPVPATIQAPLFSEYKGVQLGMTGEQARSKLGKATFSDKELDYFVLSETEAVQVGYDLQGKVKTISIDYQNGVGAPDPKTIVGAELETRDNGTLYRIVHYDKMGFWVSYNRTAGPVIIVTITIQKM